jgi:hypothetical protein
LLYIELKNNGIFVSKEERYFYDKLKKFKELDKPYIELRKLTNFPWKVACSSSPYGVDNTSEETYIDFYYKDSVTRISEHKILAKESIGSRLYFGTLVNNMEINKDLTKYYTGKLDYRYWIGGCFNNKAYIKIDKKIASYHYQEINFFYLVKNGERNVKQ